MFASIGRFLQKLGGVVPAQDLMTEAGAKVFAYRFSDEHPVIQKVFAYGLEKQFLDDYLFPTLERIGEVASKEEQILAFRKEVVELIEKEALNHFVIEGNIDVDIQQDIHSDLDEDVKDYFLALLSEPMAFEDVWKFHYGHYLMANSTKQIVIEVCEKFENAKENGWEEYYTDIYRPYIESKVKHDAKHHIGEEDDAINELMLKMLSEKIPSVKENILAGATYEYDREAEEEKRRKAEQEQELEEEGKKRPKKRMANKGEINELAELLKDWYHRFSDGNAFCLLNQPSENTAAFIQVASAIMLKTLYECIQSEKEARHAIQEALWIFIKSTFSDELKEGELEKIDDVEIDTQIALLEQTDDDEGWMTGILLPSIVFIYGLDWSSIPEEHQQEIINASVKLLDDVLKISQGTKAIFGWDVKVEGLFEAIDKN